LTTALNSGKGGGARQASAERLQVCPFQLLPNLLDGLSFLSVLNPSEFVLLNVSNSDVETATGREGSQMTGQARVSMM
jgi:hypothetical protein